MQGGVIRFVQGVVGFVDRNGRGWVAGEDGAAMCVCEQELPLCVGGSGHGWGTVVGVGGFFRGRGEAASRAPADQADGGFAGAQVGVEDVQEGGGAVDEQLEGLVDDDGVALGFQVVGQLPSRGGEFAGDGGDEDGTLGHGVGPSRGLGRLVRDWGERKSLPIWTQI